MDKINQKQKEIIDGIDIIIHDYIWSDNNNKDLDGLSETLIDYLNTFKTTCNKTHKDIIDMQLGCIMNTLTTELDASIKKYMNPKKQKKHACPKRIDDVDKTTHTFTHIVNSEQKHLVDLFDEITHGILEITKALIWSKKSSQIGNGDYLDDCRNLSDELLDYLGTFKNTKEIKDMMITTQFSQGPMHQFDVNIMIGQDEYNNHFTVHIPDRNVAAGKEFVKNTKK